MLSWLYAVAVMLMAIFFRWRGRVSVNTGGGASVGGDANSGRDVVGRDHVENNYYEQPQPLKLPANHPFNQYTFTDMIAAMVGNPLTGEPGLVARLGALEKEIAEMRRNQYPRWFQILALVMAFVLIVLLLLVLIRMR